MANCKTKNTKEHYRLLMDNLRVLRKSRKISMTEVADYLAGHGIFNDTKTLYGWENGVGSPSFDAILLLCRLYEVDDIFALAGMEKGQNPGQNVLLTEEERQIIEGYRSRPQMQESVKRLLVDPVE